MTAPQRPLEERILRLPDEPEGSPRLLGSYSPAADRTYFPVRRRCPITAEPVETVELSTTGVLYSYSKVASAFFGKVAFASDLAGFGVGQVDLPEGVRVQTIILGEEDDWKIGGHMRLELHPLRELDDGTQVVTYRFVPEETANVA